MPVIGSPRGRPFQLQSVAPRSRAGSRPVVYTISNDSGIEMCAGDRSVDGGSTPTGRGAEYEGDGSQPFDVDAHFLEMQKKRFAELQEEARRRFPLEKEGRAAQPASSRGSAITVGQLMQAARAQGGKDVARNQAYEVAEQMLDSLQSRYASEDEAPIEGS